MLKTITASLSKKIDPGLVIELLSSYSEAKRNFYLGGHRLSGVEGGRFCEAAFRIVESQIYGSFTPLGKQIKSDQIIRDAEQSLASAYPESLRLHIPRALRTVYDIRNKRDLAHLGDGIDPNLQDSTLVVSTLDWILAEFVRLYHAVTPKEAQEIVENLVTRRAPVIEDFDGFLKILNTNLGVTERVLVLLYHCASTGASFGQLEEWVAPSMRSNLKRTLRGLTHDRAFVHENKGVYQLSRSGQLEVEKRQLYEMPSR